MVKPLLNFSRWFVGLLFIFSGFIKANDPTGFSIKLNEYFELFGLHYFISWSVSIAILICVLEIVLAVALILNARIRLTSWLLLLLILFFTALTGYSAITYKVTDCGCFGDAIKLTPLQSFIKDLVLLFFILIIFIKNKTLNPVVSRKTENFLVLFSLLIVSGFALYCYNFLPVIDFLPYKTGIDIPSSMKSSAPFQFEYVYSKDGKQYRYKNIKDAPYSDSTYKFDTTYVLNPEAGPKITDYRITTPEGDDSTDASLTGIKLLVIIADLKKASLRNTKIIANLAKFISAHKIGETWLVSGSSNEESEVFRHEFQLAMPLFSGDATLLKSIVRSNPGLMLLKNGKVIKKWHNNRLPDEGEIKELCR
ncbi:MAG: hypothetical protein A3H98_11095 [Bacteroidetes bacterium RIFCSPLOWO2_02_FULL_36_8]|nr:MAG: hypothetical protein A3H98_11095 [Bacteroidetes bacterium RIFCSPLOWO2_02_FULL_36_8]OFY70595.1 MAG: hypothetical protein A3G23_07635 [Bacteroidetes bacterium RIFCSPLOWO2_12_FULL_37_12]